MTIAVKPRVRFCNLRVGGALYHAPDEAQLGNPLEMFLKCPPHPIFDEQYQSLGLSDIGINIIERPDGSGVFDAWDIIGADNYPFWPWWWEEQMHFGCISRRFPRTPQLAKLDPKHSKHLIIHPKGHIINHGEVMERLGDEGPRCPSRRSETAELHDNPPAELIGMDGMMCQRLLWQACPNPKQKGWYDVPHPDGLTFKVSTPPLHVEPLFTWAIMASFPITHFEVPMGTHDEMADMAQFWAENGPNLVYEVTEE